jgi:hypothetical protein
MHKSSIAPSAIQTLFDSAANTASKGQAQWFTPFEWARVLSLPLNDYRPVIADLTCGNGQLLQGAAEGRWQMEDGKNRKPVLLGCDLETPSPVSQLLSANFITADVTRFYPLLCAVDWKCDSFVLNPPWDLHWYREPLAKLAESECPAVREAFAAHDGRTSRDTIDSTIATLCLALDRSSSFGEGFLIGNEATLQRLLFVKDAPHRSLVEHIWAHLAIEGNICSDKAGPSGTDFQTGVIWFARGHSQGPSFNQTLTNADVKPDDKDLPGLVRRVCQRLKDDRIYHRNGPHAAIYLHTKTTQELWQAAREEQLRIDGSGKLPPFNIWFDSAAGVIRTCLNLFDTVSGRVDKTAAAALHALNGRQPIQLVVQRSQRQALIDAVKGGPTGTVWRVDPALQRAVESAIVEYNRVRAPLYPLPRIQRLGYLDEQDDILCCQPLKGGGSGGQSGTDFVAGRRYQIRSTTVATKRAGTKINNIGLPDEVEWNGQELAFFITDETGVEQCFMEGRLREENVSINLIRPGATGRKQRDLEPDACVIDFTLQELVEHFVIPEVPDVATLQPRQYAAHLKTLADIEKCLATGLDGGRAQAPFGFKSFQREDYARAALHDGVILGHDTGLGKTIAMFIWPLLKCGYVLADGHQLRPAKPVLLVVPGDGHDQTDDEFLKHFTSGLGGRLQGPVRLDSQATFLKLAKPDPRTGCFALAPNYYLTSYTQLTGNGVADFPPLDRANPERTLSQLNLKEADAIDWWNQRGKTYQRHYERLKVTPDSSWKEIEESFKAIRRISDKVVTELAQESLHVLKQLTPLPGAKPAGRRPDEARMEDGRSKMEPAPRRFNAAYPSSTLNPPSSLWELLSAEQQQFVRLEMVITRHREFSQGIGETRSLSASAAEAEGAGRKVKCVYSPSLADLCADSFSACVIDEGTKIKGDDTIIGTGVRQINAEFRLVLTATPIKNRFPDLFHLAHFVSGGHDEPTARFPYAKLDKQTFAEEFLVSERNLTKEENDSGRRGKRFIKFTPQVCNVHRAWKLLAPIILRRKKDNCGEDIVPKLRHVVRVPMGLSQAAAYQFHLKARYLDVNGRPANGAKLQALRIAAANATSDLLIRPEHDVTSGAPRSRYSYIPKVASTLELIRQVLERGEQCLVFSAFQNGLDVFSARLNEAGVKHLVLDGRLSQKRRGELARQFKQGPPRAVAEGLIGRCGTHPVALCGAECMAELHSFNLCNNVILTAYSWAFDKFEQGINRAHRLNSPWPVNVWSVICDGSIDRKLEAGIHEKKDAAELVLDGHLLGENPEEVNLAELLRIAQREFKEVKTMDEEELEQDWPRLRAALGKAFRKWKDDLRLETGGSELEAMASAPTANSKLPTAPASNLPLWRQRFIRR